MTLTPPATRITWWDVSWKDVQPRALLSRLKEVVLVTLRRLFETRGVYVQSKYRDDTWYKNIEWVVNTECGNCWEGLDISEDDVVEDHPNCPHCHVPLANDLLSKVQKDLKDSKSQLRDGRTPGKEFWQAITRQLPLPIEIEHLHSYRTEGLLSDHYELPYDLSESEREFIDVAYPQRLEYASPAAELLAGHILASGANDNLELLGDWIEQGQDYYPDATNWRIFAAQGLSSADFDRAVAVVQEGLGKANGGARLCTTLGELYWGVGMQSTALDWWFMSALLQCKSGVYDSPLPLELLRAKYTWTVFDSDEVSNPSVFEGKADLAKGLTNPAISGEYQQLAYEVSAWVEANILARKEMNRMVLLLSYIAEVRERRTRALIKQRKPDDGALVAGLTDASDWCRHGIERHNPGRIVQIPFTIPNASEEAAHCHACGSGLLL